MSQFFTLGGHSIGVSALASVFFFFPDVQAVFFPFVFFLFFILFNLTLQYCIGFAIYQNESATGIHVFPMNTQD